MSQDLLQLMLATISATWHGRHRFAAQLITQMADKWGDQEQAQQIKDMLAHLQNEDVAHKVHPI